MNPLYIALLVTLIVFGYASADNAVSPLVSVFQNFFHVPEANVLYLISSCTFGIVLGSLIGPIFVARYTAPKLLLFSAIVLSLSTAFFIIVDYFYAAIIFRFIFGLCCGFFAAVIWWITFHKVTGKASDIMVVVTLTTRPLAMCLGIPLVGFLTSITSWQISYAFLVAVLLVSSLLLFFALSKSDTYSHQEIIPATSFMQEYKNVFALSHSFKFYFGVLLNSFAYFGFYAFAGIWFTRHYNLNFLQISTMFLLIGGAEVAINFISPYIYRTFNYHKALLINCVSAIIVFALFIYAYFPLYASLLLILLFIMFNRALIFAILRTLPTAFSAHKNKTTLGSLITLSMWLGFALVSEVQGSMLSYVDINAVETMLFVILTFGTILIFMTQKKLTFATVDTIK